MHAVSWLAFVPILLVAVVVLTAPGVLVGWMLRLRGLQLVAAAAPLSVSVIAVASFIAPVAGLSWSPVPVLALTAAAALAAYAWSRWAGTPMTPSRGRGRGRVWPTVLAVVAPALLIGFILMRSFGSPEYISQRYDNFFHLNAVQYVLDTGNASPLWLGTMTSGDTGGLPFYPSAWHAVVSLISMSSGGSVAASTNAAIIVVAAIVWPLSAVLLVRTLLGGSRVTTVAGGVLAAAFPAFPFLPLHYGVLYPLFLGLASLPVALAVIANSIRPGRASRRQDQLLLFVLLLPGLGAAHPGALVALLALSLPFAVALIVVAARRARTGAGRVAWIGAGVAYAAIGVVLLWIVRPPADQIYWGVIESLPQAIGEVVSAAVFQYPLAPVVAALLAVGAYSAVRRPSTSRWLVLWMAVIAGVLYIVVAGSPIETLRLWLTGPWYNNAPRLASIWAVGVLPLAALGAASFWRFALRRIAVLRRWDAVRPAAVTLAAAIVLAVATQGVAMRQAAADIEYTYELRGEGPILTPDEYALILRLPELAPADAVLAGDPYTGASFAYGIADRRVLMPHLLMEVSDAARTINTRFAESGDSPAMCSALRETGVTYVLDFSAGGDFMTNDADYSGLEDLADSPFVELVAESGEARLYRITSCGLAS